MGFLLATNLGKAFVGGPTSQSNSLKSSALRSPTYVETKRREIKWIEEQSIAVRKSFRNRGTPDDAGLILG